MATTLFECRADGESLELHEYARPVRRVETQMIGGGQISLPPILARYAALPVQPGPATMFGMRWVADLVYFIAGLVYLPVALYNALIVGKNRSGWGERFGFIRPNASSLPCIWIHAVSLGEVNCTPQLVDELRERLPDHDFVLSTTTDTGFARAVKLYGRSRVFRCPLDFSLVIGRVLRNLQPKLIVLVELELWYNMVRMATRRGIPVVIANGRLTERSARRFAILGRAAKSMFADLRWVGTQDKAIASRFVALGVLPERITVTSSLKWDTAEVADHIDGEEALARLLGIDREPGLWVCGSTGPGEEEMILDAYQRMQGRGNKPARVAQGDSAEVGESVCPQLVIVPRKPERFDDVARMIGASGFTCVRRSERLDERPHEVSPHEEVILGDTMGELRKFYSLAHVTFVGRSLVPMGGSDPIEVAALGKPVIVGPYTDNFRLPIAALAANDAVRVVVNAESLAGEVLRLMRLPDECRALGRRAREVVLQNQGATSRTADGIMNALADTSAASKCILEQHAFTAMKSVD